MNFSSKLNYNSLDGLYLTVACLSTSFTKLRHTKAASAVGWNPYLHWLNSCPSLTLPRNWCNSCTPSGRWPAVFARHKIQHYGFVNALSHIAICLVHVSWASNLARVDTSYYRGSDDMIKQSGKNELWDFIELCQAGAPFYFLFWCFFFNFYWAVHTEATAWRDFFISFRCASFPGFPLRQKTCRYSTIYLGAASHFVWPLHLP